MEKSKKRHLAKILTWRITATLTTMIIAWVVSGDSLTGLTIGGIEFFIKMPVYYLHERAWYNSNQELLDLKKLKSKGTYFAKVLDIDGNVIAIKKLIYQ